MTLTVTATSTDGSTSQETFSISVSDVAESYQMSGSTFTDIGVSETTITGNVGADIFFSSRRRHTRYSGAGADLVYGGAGDDTILYGEGADTVYGGGGNDFIDDVVGTEPNTDNNYLDGGEGNDTIYGGGGDDNIIGGEGNDYLSGEGDNDTLEGGAGNDSIDGGGGTDYAVYSGNRADYTITESSGTYTVVDNRTDSPEGTDTVTNVEFFSFADGDHAAATIVIPTDLEFTGNTDLTIENDYALQLNDSGATTEYASVSSFDGFNNNSFTFEMSFTMNDTGSTQSLVSYADSSYANEFLIFYETDGTMTVALGNEHFSIGSGLDLADGSQHTVSLAFDETMNSVSLYVDGALADTESGLSFLAEVSSGGTLMFGQEQDSVGGSFDSTQIMSGEIYEARVWSDVRTSDEISSNWDSQLSDPGSESNLTSNWQFTTGSSSDLAGSNDISLANGAELAVTASTIQSGSVVASVSSVIDTDAGDTHTFLLTDDAGGKFAIDTNSGEISLVGSHDASSVYSDTVTVQVTDGGGNTFTETVGIELGTNNADTITGSSNDDVIYGFDGNDTLNGGAGDDSIYTGSGGDTVDGGEGSDTIMLDDIDGGNTNTIVDTGTSGTDTIVLGTGSGTYRIQGDFSSTSGIEVIDGSSATGDQLGTNDAQANFDFSNVTLTGVDEIIGTSNNDTIVGSSGDDTISLNSGDDTVTGGAGDDIIDGASGTDAVVYSGNYADYTITDNGDDTYTVADNVGTDGSDTISNIETLRFADGDQSMSDLFGSDIGAVSDADVSSNSIHETDAAGTQIGITASATDVDGDTVTYTLSDDRFEVDDSGVVTVADHAFFDSQVESSIDLAVTATSSDGSTSSETFTVSVDGTYDNSFTGTTSSGYFDQSSDTASHSVDGVGGNDTIYTGSGDDRIEGGSVSGDDAISGGGGRDLLFGETGTDNISGGSGDDVIVGGEGSDYMNGGDGSDLFMYGLGDGSDTINAGSGVAWTDVIDLGGGPGITAAGEYGTDWTVTVTNGSIDSVDTENGVIDLSQDTDGYIDFADGSQVIFADVEEIRW
ncbi:Hemolysin IA [Roseibium album]|nr:Hemolysin IA [Roseibium album]